MRESGTWDYEGLIRKVHVYFARAREHPRADGEIFALWLLLGLEFLLRAPLARVSPMLLADLNGDALMHAAGFPGKPGAEPKSVPLTTVIQRLSRIVDGFDQDRQNDAVILVGLRNRELHSSEAAMTVNESKWLPRFMRIVDVIGPHLGLDPVFLLGEQVVKQARALVDAEDRRLERETKQRVEARRAFFAELHEDEVAARRDMVPHIGDALLPWPGEAANCPSCATLIGVESEPVRTTDERLQGGGIYRDVIYVVTGMSCPVCGLELKSTAEVSCAGLQQQYMKHEYESLEDRFLQDYEPDEDEDEDE
ncbi:hypothetical protein [Micromonospora sp. NPDC049301]|uniref:hypothetical protein n=1 Tax=Micromonospora sp. NPDC049301 TaxID=3155723 RepID=UPI00344829A5